MIRIALRMLAVLSLTRAVYGVYPYRDHLWLSMKGGYTLFAPGSYETMHEHFRLTEYFLVTAVLLVALSFVPRGRTRTSRK